MIQIEEMVCNVLMETEWRRKRYRRRKQRYRRKVGEENEKVKKVSNQEKIRKEGSNITLCERIHKDYIHITSSLWTSTI